MAQSDYQQQVTSDKPVNGKAIATLVLGICSLIIPYVGLIIGIIGIILGRKSFKEIKQYNQGGYGLAMGGFVTSIIGTSLYSLIIIIVLIFGVAVGLSGGV